MHFNYLKRNNIKVTRNVILTIKKNSNTFSALLLQSKSVFCHNIAKILLTKYDDIVS